MALYLQYFGLSEAPFSITPDPSFVYLSPRHRDALAHLLYGVGQGSAGGFVQLTGEVGTGKTTMCRCLLEHVPEDAQIALILNPLMTPLELVATICEELGIDTAGIDGSSKALVDTLNHYLLEQHAAGNRVVVVIDEAQNLSPEALEQVRLLTNLETSKHKLLQMVLLGQPELRQLLQRQNLRQLAQRITARFHLTPLNEEETAEYVRHRMRVGGAQRNAFTRSALRALYQRSDGVPRLINIIADRALAGAYALEKQNVNAKLVNAAASEVQPSEPRVRGSRWPWVVAAASGLALIAVTVAMQRSPWLGKEQPAPVADRGSAPASASEPPEAAPAEPQPEIGVIGAEPTPEPAAVGAESTPEFTAIAAESPPEQIVIRDELQTDWLAAEHAQAWQTMARLWQDEGNPEAIQAACDGARGTGYACLHDQGSWGRVAQLGLPVLLVLNEEVPRYLVLRGIRDDAILVGGGEPALEVSRRAVEDVWLGDFIVPWPQAPDWPNEIQRGESGSAVDIVMEMASYADPAWHGSGVFDAGFESWLMSFQRRHGLEADGIVGPNTLLYLMAPTISQPRLILGQDERS